MSTTSQPTDFSDLFTDLQNRVRVTTGQSATETQAKRYINIANNDLYLNFDYKWPWVERRGILRTHASYATGTVSVTKGSDAITGSGTAWNTAGTFGENNVRTTGKLTIAGGTDIYHVHAVGGDTALTLGDGAGTAFRYIGETDTAATYQYFEDEYALASNFLKPVDFRKFSTPLGIDFISRKDFRKAFPRPITGGNPKYACLLDLAFAGSTTPVRRVQLAPYPTTEYLIPYDYICNELAVSSAGVAGPTLSANADEPTMPLRYRHLIVLGALQHWYRDKKDDARSREVKEDYVDGVLRMASDLEIATHTDAQMTPMSGAYARHARTPYRRGRGRQISINNEFDRMER